MAETASAFLLGQVDDHLARFVVRCSRIDATGAAGAKRQAKFSVQRERFRRNANNRCHIHQRIKRIVQILLALFLFNPVAELDAFEAKRLGKQFRRYILTTAHIFANTRVVCVAANSGDFFRLFQSSDQLFLVVSTIRSRLFHSIKRPGKLGDIAPHFLADIELVSLRVQVKRYRAVGFLVQVDLVVHLLELLQDLGLGFSSDDFCRPVAECSRLGLLLD